MDIGKILFTLSYVKYKQFDFSYRKKRTFPQYYKNCWESCFNSNLKGRRCFYLFLYNCVHGEGEGEGEGEGK